MSWDGVSAVSKLALETALGSQSYGSPRASISKAVSLPTSVDHEYVRSWNLPSSCSLTVRGGLWIPWRDVLCTDQHGSYVIFCE